MSADCPAPLPEPTINVSGAPRTPPEPRSKVAQPGGRRMTVAGSVQELVLFPSIDNYGPDADKWKAPFFLTNIILLWGRFRRPKPPLLSTSMGFTNVVQKFFKILFAFYHSVVGEDGLSQRKHAYTLRYLLFREKISILLL